MDNSELQRVVRETDPAALLVLPRILRRVIKQDRRLAGYLYRIPHRKSYLIDRVALLDIVDYEELGISPEVGLPEKVILLAQPSPEKLAFTPAGEALLRCWRLLFHARVHLALEQCFILGFLSPSQLEKRLHELGETEFAEIRAVLQQEGFLLPPHDDAAAYEEFVALFFELKYFAWNSLPRYFPGLRNFEAVAFVLEQDINARKLFEASRPRGAPDPKDEISVDDLGDWITDAEERPPSSLPSNEEPSETKFRRYLRRAQRTSTLGNVVRAAIWRAKALRYAPAEVVARTKSDIRDDVNRLILRLHAALELDNPSPQPWHDTLRALVYSAADGFWTAEGRLLYDLQKVCIDHEREIYTTNPIRWLWSRTKFAVRRIGGILKTRRIDREDEAAENANSELEPLKCLLPNQREVLKSQHLRTAQRRLTAVRLPEKQRKQLSELLCTAIERVESQLRERFRPLLHRAFDEVGLTPANFPEKVARDKIVEELLDQTAERGFLSIGELRDGLSRNNMKLPDFGGAKDLYYGDPVLKADRRLSDILRGIYRPADFYLRWLQQLTSLGFGTRIGRILTLYVAVPFGGAFLVQRFIDHIFHRVWPGICRLEVPLFWLMSCLFFGLVNAAGFRRMCWHALKYAYHFLGHWLFLPLWRIAHSQIVQAILHSGIFRAFTRYVIKPAFWTTLLWFIFLRGLPWPAAVGRGVVLFVSLNLFLNSRVGRAIEEMIADWLVQTWHRYGLRFILNVFWWIVDLFKTLLEAVERLMYSVDEWLRFKSGESQTLFAAKAVLGVGWAAVAYVLRFGVNLLVEPQINPIKHFPVVTVSHKLLLPLIPPFGQILAAHMEKEWAYTLAGAIIAGIPGIFGFLVWELKENWRLYAANRPQGLQPMIIGHHGETMGRLLKPGFHSGTIPKLFAKLRRAERKARKSGNWKTVRKHLHGFEHVEKSLRRYVERDFLALHNGSRSGETLDGDRLVLREIEFSTNRVRLVFSAAESGQSNLAIDFEVQSGWLLGSVGQNNAIQEFAQGECKVLSTAVLGLYKTAGAEIVRQHLETAFSPPISAYEFATRRLRIWPEGSYETEAFYEFSDAERFVPQVLHGMLPRDLPVLNREQILFREAIVRWDRWVAFWDAVNRGDLRKAHNLLFFQVLRPGEIESTAIIQGK